MEVDRKISFFFQRFNQRTARRRLQQTSHVFQTQNMCASGFKFLGHTDIVFQVILITRRIKQITRVTNGALNHFARFANGIHSNTHVFNPVQAVKHAEHIHTTVGRLGDK